MRDIKLYRKNIGKTALILCLAVLWMAAGCGNSSKSKEELFKEGMKFVEQKKYQGAVVLFKTALEKDPNFFEARFQLAKAYIHSGHLDSAEKDLLKVTKQSPSFKDAHVELARVYVYEQKTDQALKEISDYIGETSADADALEVAGMASVNRREYAAAERFFQRAVSADTGKKTTAELSLARLYMIQGKPLDAKAQIDMVLKRDASSEKALYLLAEIQTNANEKDEALKTYDRILKDNPNDIEAFFKKGQILVDKKQYDAALSLSDKIIGKFPKRPEGYRLKGIVLVLKNNPGDAIAVLQRSLSFQQNVGAYYFLGLAQLAKNEPEQAVTQFNKALDINPSFHQARMVLATTLLRQKRVDDAIKEISKVTETDNQNAMAHNILGSAYMAKGMLNEGMEELNKAIEIDPGLAGVYVKKGLVNIRRGKPKEAETDLRAAVQAAPDILNSRLLLAAYYTKAHDYSKAVSVLNSGLRGTKSDAVLYNYMVMVLLKQDNKDAAITTLTKAKASDPDFLSSYFNLAALYIMKKDYDRGIQELKSVLSKSPDNLKALLELAGVYEVRGMDSEAGKYFNQAKATKKIEGYVASANHYVRKKEYDKAIGVLNEAIAQSPSDTAPYQLKANILVSLKKYEEALRTLEQIEKINPKLAFMPIVNTYLVMKKPDDAMNKVNKELNKDPRNVNLMAEVSRIYMIMGKKDKAIANAKAIITAQPDSPAGYITLAAIYSDSREIDNAVDTLRKASRLKNANLDMMLGGLYASRKDYNSALEIYKAVEKSNPGYVQAIFQQGAVFNAMGKNKNAMEEYLRVLKLSNNYLPALNNLAYIYANENRELDKAMQLASMAYSIAPNDGGVADTMGYVLLKKNKTEDAVKLLKRASELLPDNPTVYYHLALAYKGQSDRTQAVACLEKAVKMGNFPDEGNARSLLEKLKRG